MRDTSIGALDREQFGALAKRLEARHDVFAAVWEMGRPEFTDGISTACVEFNAKGEWVRFLFNPDFWHGLDAYGREFVVCHEVLHVVLAHGVRTTHLSARVRANVAADLVVNHLLVDRYGFVRELVRGWEALCWRDTVFEVPWVRHVETLEGYYEALKRTPSVLRTLVDTHAFASRLYEEHGLKARIDRFQRAFEARFGTGHLGELISGGHLLGQEGWSLGEGGLWADVGPGRARMRWAAILRRVLGGTVDANAETWRTPSRRWSGLPLELPGRGGEKSRKQLALFLDTSGSCWNQRRELVRVARSLEDRVQLKAFAFDTEAVPLGPKIVRVWGGGGTDFRCIEKCVSAMPRYPDAVVVLTDGVGCHADPLHPKRWHWVLTDSGPVELPKGCHRHVLGKMLEG